MSQPVLQARYWSQWESRYLPIPDAELITIEGFEEFKLWLHPCLNSGDGRYGVTEHESGRYVTSGAPNKLGAVHEATSILTPLGPDKLREFISLSLRVQQSLEAA